MMAEYTQTYWNELIDKYRNGSISENERFQLEKQALDDPFLFDALEGLSLYNNNESEENKKIVPIKRIFTLPRIGIAASIVFLVAVMFNLQSDKSSIAEKDNSIAMVLESSEEVSSVGNGQEDVESEVSVATTTADKANEPSANQKDIDPEPKVAANNNAKKNREKSNIEKVEHNVPTAPKPIQNNVKDEEEIELIDYDISDEVVSEDKKQVEEINIAKEKPSSDDMLAEEVVVKVGDMANASSFESRVSKEESEIIQVADENATEEEFVAKKRKASPSLYFEAVPVIGKSIFDDYAKERIDKRGLRQEKPQKVTIEFTIDKNGNLDNFRHIFTGCPECAPFAIALLQNSGEWKTVPPGYAGKARYTFIF